MIAPRYRRLMILVGVLVLCFSLAQVTGLHRELSDPERRVQALEALRDAADIWWVGPAFALAYALAVGLGMPALIPTLLGGAAFGFFPGIIWVLIGANLGANLGFYLARRLGRDAVAGMGGPRMAAFDRYSEVAGFEGLLVLRLLLVTPFTPLNYAAGLTAISWRDFALATAFASLPVGAIYVFFADALLTGSAEPRREILIRAGLTGLLLVGVTLTIRWLLTRRRSSSRTTPQP
ncbi:MAG TPA: VTT domain-containing protein [Gemmatimonadales bacterium]|nr:VTT domain-containing protein [Gemmatimonadales bacterium]